jgi:hypothetical protein
VVHHATPEPPHRSSSAPVARGFKALRVSETRRHQQTHKLLKLINTTSAHIIASRSIKKYSQLFTKHFKPSTASKQSLSLYLKRKERENKVKKKEFSYCVFKP